MTYYTNDPTRFGGCYATHDPTASQVMSPVITDQPDDQTIATGGTAVLSVTATGIMLTYQWYQGASGNTGTPLVGETASSVSVSPASTTSYWVRVTSNGVYTTDSTAATVTVSGSVVSTIPMGGSGHPAKHTGPRKKHRTLEGIVSGWVDSTVREVFGYVDDANSTADHREAAREIVSAYQAEDGPIDWARIESDATATAKLLRLYQSEKRRRELLDDDDEFMLLS